MPKVRDIRVPAAPDTLMRSVALTEPGLWRLSRRDCEFNSIMITGAGSFGRVAVEDGKGRRLFLQISAFTGSFAIGGFAEGGLSVELAAESLVPDVTVSWREADAELV